MKAFALLLLASLALASVMDGATPGAPAIAVEMSETGPEAGPEDVPGSADAHEAVVAVPAMGQARAPREFAEAARVPVAWVVASDVPPPEA